MKTAPPPLIYIAGIAPRSGTNYVYRLITDHPYCILSAGGEDYFLLKSDFLYLFSEAIYNKWQPEWGFKENNTPDDLLSALGYGLTEFLKGQQSNEDNKEISTVVTKTPHVDNVQRFSELFPEGFLVILVRDGRAVTESSIRTFDLSFDDAANIWRDGAQKVISFIEEYGYSSDWHRVLYYEEVVEQTRKQIYRLFEHVGLDPDLYPFGNLNSIPVVGSSTYGREKEVTWKEKEADESFDPTRRFSSWDEDRHERFEWIAGKELQTLGYTSGTSSIGTWPKTVRQCLIDIKRIPKSTFAAAKRGAKKLVYSYILR